MKSVETVAGIIDYLNQCSRELYQSDTYHEHPLAIGDDHVYAQYAGFRLGSLFQPIVERSDEDGYRIVAYEAFLAAHTVQGLAPLGSALSPETLFSLPNNQQEITILDRLARTLHALNFLLQDVSQRLHLNVNPHHLLAVSTDHGLVFETILQQCGLDPSSIVLEIPEHGIRDKSRLRAAIRSWQSRGYDIALDNFGVSHNQLDRVLALKPNILKINRTLSAIANPTMRDLALLRQAVTKAHDQQIAIIATGIETAPQQSLLEDIGFTQLQGYRHGRPSAHCQLTIPTQNPAPTIDDAVQFG